MKVPACGTVAHYRSGCRLPACRKANADYQAAYRAKDPQRERDYQRQWRVALRAEVLGHYGSACVCCGERQIEFLALDHKDGGGNRHREELGLRGSAIWAWVKREGFPDLFQVMCHNCNQAKGYYGECPHRREADRILRAV